MWSSTQIAEKAIKRLGRTLRAVTLARDIKMATTVLHRPYKVEVRVDCMPGHAGGIGDGATQALVSEHMGNRSVLVTPTMPAPDDPDPTATLLAAKKERRYALQRQVPAKNTHCPEVWRVGLSSLSTRHVLS